MLYTNADSAFVARQTPSGAFRQSVSQPAVQPTFLRQLCQNFWHPVLRNVMKLLDEHSLRAIKNLVRTGPKDDKDAKFCEQVRRTRAV